MLRKIDVLKATRDNLLSLISNLSVDQLNHIPANFNNNLIWNMGHVIVTQQLLCYPPSGFPCRISEDLIERYRKGSRPTTPVGAEEIKQIESYMFVLAEQIDTDVQMHIFQEYKPYKTSYNLTLNSIEDALTFNNIHESMHLGYCIALKKLL